MTRGAGQVGDTPGVEAQQVGGDLVLVVDRGREHRRVVGVDRHGHARGDQRRQRVLGERGHGPGADVGRRAHLERDLLLAQPRQQPFVPSRGDAMTDAFGAEGVQGLPHRLGAGRLAGVRHAVQAGRASGLEVVGEQAARHAQLGAAEPEADQPVRAHEQGDVEGDVACLDAGLAGDVEAPAQLHAVVLLGAAPGVLDGVAERLRRDAARHRRVGREGQLGVADVLRGEVAADVVGERPHVLGVADQVDDGQVDLDEVREVGEGEVVGQLVRIGRHRRRAVVAGRQLRDGVRRRRADVVHVQFGLGQPGDEVGVGAHRLAFCRRG